MPNIRHPSPALVEDAKRKWHENDRFVVQEKSIRLLFDKLCPLHNDLAEVLTKVTVLNAFYSTNVYYKLDVAKRIVKLNPSDRIAAGDTALVNELAAVLVDGKPYRYYSFASKYCSQHNPDAFPIYDDFVSQMLRHFGSVDGFAKFGAKDLKDYPRFVQVIRTFREFYGLGQYSLRWIDRYLWFDGRAAFGRSGAKQKVSNVPTK